MARAGNPARQPKRRVPSRRIGLRPSLAVEGLEDRLVMSNLPMPVHLPPPELDYFLVTGAPASVTAGTPFAVTVTEYAYATGKVTGTVNSASMAIDFGGTDTPLPALSLSAGSGKDTITLTKAESGVEIFATSGSIQNIKSYVSGATAPITVNPAGMSQLIVSAPTTETSGKAFNVSITAKDKYGNIDTSYATAPTFSASDGQTVSLNSIHWSNGVGTASVTLNEPDILTLTVSDQGVSGTVKQTTGSIFVQGPSQTNSIWSGYVASPGSGVTAVAGTWVEPTTSGPGASSIWVGIDGFNGSTVEQLGVATSVVNGSTVYTPWIEFFGDKQASTGKLGPLYYQTTIPNFTVKPGDTISAEVSLVPGTANSFLFQMTDKPKSGGATEVYSATKTMSYVVPQLATAEWIVENPNGGFYPGTKTVQPLADFGQVNFTGAWATISGKSGGFNGLANLLALNMAGSQAQDVTTDPASLLNSLGYNEPGTGKTSSSFAVTWL